MKKLFIITAILTLAFVHSESFSQTCVKPNAGSNRTICAKDSVKLNNPSGTQVWSLGNQPAAATIAANGLVTNMTAAGIYEFILTDGTCKDTAKITRPEIPFSSSTRSICGNNTTTLSVTGLLTGTTFEWSPNGETSQSITVSTAGTYKLLTTGPTGCLQTFEWVVSTFPFPTINTTGSLLICPGSSTELNATGGGTYEWKNPMSMIISSTSNSSSISTAGVYSLKVTKDGCSTTLNATINLASKPNAGRDTIVCAPEITVQLATIVSGATWSSATSNPSGVSITSPGGLVSGLNTNGESLFIFKNNTSGCADTVKVTKQDALFAGADQTVCGSTSITLTPAGSGEQWRIAAQPNGATSTISQAGVVSGISVQGFYYYVLSNAVCNDVIKITKYNKPNAGNDTTLCAPATSIQIYQIISGASWSSAALNPSGVTIGASSGVATGLNANGNYQFIITNTASGCTDTVNVVRIDKPNAGPDLQLCGNVSIAKLPAGNWTVRASNPATATVSANGNVSGMTVNGTYQFYLSVGSCIDTVNIRRSNKFEVANDTTLCAPATSLQLPSVLSGSSWSAFDVPSSIGSTSGLAVNMTQNGIYRFAFTNTSNGCADTVSINRMDKPNAGSDLKICGAATTAQVSGSPSGGTWSGLSTNPTGAGINSAGAVSGLTIGTFRFIYTTGVCTDTVRIEKFTKPNAGTDINICESATTTELGTTTGAGAWGVISGNPSNASVGTTSGSVAGMNTLGTYQFSFANTSTGCQDTIAVIKNAKPVITILSKNCSFDNTKYDVAISATSGVITASAGTVKGDSIVNITAGTNITITSTLFAGCSSSIEVTAPTCTVSCIKPAAPMVSTASTTICNGQSATLTATTCETGSTIKWSTGETTASINITTTGSYSAICTKACGDSPISDVIVATFQSAPSAPTLSGGGSICAGSSSIITATNCSGTLKWFKGSTLISGQTGPTLSVVAVGSYAATCTSTCGESVKSTPVIVTIDATPAAPTLSGNGSICNGVANIITASGCNGTLKWYEGSTIIAGQTATTLSVSIADYYAATCTSSCGESDKSTPLIVSVESSSAAPILTGGGSICPNTSSTITASGCTGTLKWYNGNTIIAGQSAATLLVNAAGTYSATCSGSCGESAKSTAVSVTIDASPTAPSVTGGGSICDGTTTTLTASGCNGTLKWFERNVLINSQSATTLIVSAEGSYTATCTSACGESESSRLIAVNIISVPFSPVIISDKSGICTGDSATLSAIGCNNQSTVKWSNGATTNQITVKTSGTYSAVCVGVCGNGSTSSSFNLLLQPQEAPSISGNSIICSGSTGTLTASGCTGILKWYEGNSIIVGQSATILSVSTAGSFSATCSTSCGESTKSTVITVNIDQNKPTIPTVSGGGNGNICPGSLTTITASGCNGSLKWYDGNTLITGQTATTLSATTAGSYSATCSTACGESAKSSAIDISIEASSNAPFVTLAGRICLGSSITITASGCNGSLKWYDGNTLIAGQTATTLSATTAGSYSATCSGICGESSKSAAAVVTVSSKPEAPTVDGVGNICPNEIATLVARDCSSSIKWYRGTNEIIGQTGLTLAASTPGNYAATCSNICGESTKSIAAVLTLSSTPSAPTVSGGGVICSGASSTITATNCNGSIQWYNGNTLISDQTATTLTVSTAGSYSASCSSACGISAKSNLATVISASSAAAPTLSSSTTSVCTGSSITISSSACEAGFSLKWSIGAIATPTISVSTAGDYTAVCSNSCGDSPVSNIVKIKIGTRPSPPTISNAGCSGQTVTLSATQCEAGSSIKWSNGFATQTVIVNSAGNYTAVCSNDCGDSPVSNTLAVVINCPCSVPACVPIKLIRVR